MIHAQQVGVYGSVSSNPILSLNPVLYLDAAQGVTESGGLVSAWANQGTGLTNATQGTGSAQPTFNASGFGVNSLPYLDFDGSSDFMSLETEYSGMTEHTIFTVHIRDNSLTNSQIIIADGDASGDSLLPRTSLVHRYRNNSLDVTYGDGTDFRIIRSSETFTSTTNVYITMDFKATGVALNTMQVNGTDLTENTIVGTATEIGGAPTPTYISQWGASGGAFFDGKIAEILVFDYVLTSSQITSVTNFLKSKYGIS